MLLLLNKKILEMSHRLTEMKPKMLKKEALKANALIKAFYGPPDFFNRTFDLAVLESF